MVNCVGRTAKQLKKKYNRLKFMFQRSDVRLSTKKYATLIFNMTYHFVQQGEPSKKVADNNEEVSDFFQRHQKPAGKSTSISASRSTFRSTPRSAHRATGETTCTTAATSSQATNISPVSQSQ